MQTNETTIDSMIETSATIDDVSASSVETGAPEQTTVACATVLTLPMLGVALNENESRYLAKNPQDKGGNELQSSADIRKARKFLTPENVAHAGDLLAKAGIDGQALCDAVAKRQPVKASMRMCEFFSALHSGNYKLLDAVTVLTILANVQAGAQTRAAVSFAVTGKGDENTSDQVRNIERVKRLQRIVPNKVGAGTEPTQVSRSFGKAGFCGDIGLGRFVYDEKRETRTLKVDGRNPFYKMVARMIDKASDATLKTMKGAKDETK